MNLESYSSAPRSRFLHPPARYASPRCSSCCAVGYPASCAVIVIRCAGGSFCLSVCSREVAVEASFAFVLPQTDPS